VKTKQDVKVNINDTPTINMTLHITGLKLWLFRMWIIKWLLILVNLIAPKNVYFGLCEECCNATKNRADKDNQEETQYQTSTIKETEKQ